MKRQSSKAKESVFMKRKDLSHTITLLYKGPHQTATNKKNGEKDSPRGSDNAEDDSHSKVTILKTDLAIVIIYLYMHFY